MFAVGSVVMGKYRVLRGLNPGGMARVYEVLPMGGTPGPALALKENCAPAKDDVERREMAELFRQEADFLRQLRHPGVPRFIEYFELGQVGCIVMEFVRGHSLDWQLKDPSALAGLPAPDVLGWVHQATGIFEYLHAQQPAPVIYRDIKPANLMLTPEGRIMVVDFGIARRYKAGKKGNTVDIGTEAYMAPELFDRQQADVLTDVYALGATMYHLLVGAPPPHAKMPGSVPVPSAVQPQLGQQVDQVVLRALAKPRSQRTPSMAALRTDLESIPGLAPSPTVPACPVCGADLRVAARFCGRCGTAADGRLRAAVLVLHIPGQALPQRLALARCPYLIGRRSDADGIRPDLDLAPFDPGHTVSRRHAQIIQQGAQYAVVDLGSANRTRVNDVTLTPNAAHPLRMGDTIRIAGMRLELMPA